MKFSFLFIILVSVICCISCSQNVIKESVIDKKQDNIINKPLTTQKSIIRITIKPIKKVEKPKPVTRPTTRPTIQPTSRPVIQQNIITPPVLVLKPQIPILPKKTNIDFQIIENIDIKYIAMFIGGLIAILGLIFMFLKTYSAIFAIIFGNIMIIISLLFEQHPYIILMFPIFIAITCVWFFFFSRVFQKIKLDSS